MESQEKQVKITNNMAAVLADGHGIGVNSENGATQLMFIQVTTQRKPGDPEPKELEATMVASIRMSLEQVEKLIKDLQSNITAYKDAKAKSETEEPK